MKKEKEKTGPEILTTDLRKTLKAILKTEIEKLPEYLETLEPEKRLNVICKLIPFVLPKVESVTHTLGEPGQSEGSFFDWNN
jgi:hypothetical protein